MSQVTVTDQKCSYTWQYARVVPIILAPISNQSLYLAISCCCDCISDGKTWESFVLPYKHINCLVCYSMCVPCEKRVCECESSILSSSCFISVHIKNIMHECCTLLYCLCPVWQIEMYSGPAWARILAQCTLTLGILFRCFLAFVACSPILIFLRWFDDNNKKKHKKTKKTPMRQSWVMVSGLTTTFSESSMYFQAVVWAEKKSGVCLFVCTHVHHTAITLLHQWLKQHLCGKKGKLEGLTGLHVLLKLDSSVNERIALKVHKLHILTDDTYIDLASISQWGTPFGLSSLWFSVLNQEIYFHQWIEQKIHLE